MSKESESKARGISRRDFMKTSSIAAGGLMLGTLPFGASAYAGGNDTLNLALVGCGNRGTGAIANALDAADGVRLVAMADIYEDRLRGSHEILKMRYGNSEKLAVTEDQMFIGFDAYKKAISAADVVLLTTPTFWRPLHYEEAVRQGKHIFMEKPVAVDAPGVRRVLQAARVARQKELNVVVGLQRRYSSKYREIYNRIQDGAIGDILSGSVYWMEGPFGELRNNREWSELEMQIRNQFQFFWTSGGQVLDQLIHNIDIANWFIGNHPESAQGMGGRNENITGPDVGQVYDHSFIEYTYPGGVMVSAQGRRQTNTMVRVAERLVGTEGISYTQGFADYGIILDRDENPVFDYRGNNEENPYVVEHQELFEAIRSGNRIDNSERAAITTMTAIMGFMATYSGDLISWEEALNSDMTFYPAHGIQPSELGYDTPPPVMRGEDGYYPVPIPGQTEVL